MGTSDDTPSVILRCVTCCSCEGPPVFEGSMLTVFWDSSVSFCGVIVQLSWYSCSDVSLCSMTRFKYISYNHLQTISPLSYYRRGITVGRMDLKKPRKGQWTHWKAIKIMVNIYNILCSLTSSLCDLQSIQWDDITIFPGYGVGTGTPGDLETQPWLYSKAISQAGFRFKCLFYHTPGDTWS